MDANWAAGQLPQDPGASQPLTGLRAPCATTVLDAQELAQMLAEDEDGTALEPRNHGAIDQVDSQLVTGLQRKLAAEGQGASSSTSQPFAPADLAAALERGLQDQQFSSVTAVPEDPGSPAGFHSGLRAPHATVNLSSLALQSLDEDVEDSRNNPGQMQNIDDHLVLELQRKLCSQPNLSGEDSQQFDSTIPAGVLAPQNTTKLSADVLQMLSDEDDRQEADVDTIDLNLVSELQRKLEGGGQEQCQAPLPGTRAPDPTLMLTPSMLQGLDDEP